MYSVLDLYILSMLDEGLQTPYDLQKDAALSLGAIVPALRRLSKEKLVTRDEASTSTNRPKHLYQLTGAGRKALKTSWQPYLVEGKEPTDIDALLRLLDVAQRYGAKSSRLKSFLRGAASRRKTAAAALVASKGSSTERFAYRLTRGKVEILRLRAEAQALTEIANGTKPKIGAKRKRNPQAPNQLLFPGVIVDQPKRPS